jgi:Na+/H+ antiporter NhaD/arsenite permease-like protein
MVAAKWGWDLPFMLTHFAPKTFLATFLNTLFMIFIFKKEIVKGELNSESTDKRKIPFLVVLVHLLFLLFIVLTAHYPILFIGLFLFFIGFLKATHEYQSQLSLREPLLVGFFLAGLIVLGGPQRWWLEPIIISLNKYQLYFGSIGLTAFTDNAALTYLGSLVPTLDFESKLALVKGSVVGGGLTLIANAPNPAGYGILRNSFEDGAFSPLKLFYWSIPITIMTMIIFLL